MQSLQQQAATYAGMATTLCGRLGWEHLARRLRADAENRRAQARAELVAAAAGVALGPVVSVRERGAYNGEGNGMGFEEMAEVSMLAQSQMLLANESRVTVSVVVSYELSDG